VARGARSSRCGLGRGRAAIDRLVRETSAYYLLSVEPLSTERDGKPHTITVKVKAPNATVRNRSFVVIPKAKGPVAPK